MKRPRTVKVAATVGAVGLAMLTAHPLLVMAQDSPAFRIDGWQLQPETLTRGSEFDLTLEIDNAGEGDAVEVIVSIGQDNNFVQLSSSKHFDEIEGGDTETVTLRGAVSNTITTGHYSLPIQISYYQTATGAGERLSEDESIGVHVQGIAPSIQDYGRPRLVIEGSELQPSDESGRLDLTLTLRNTGDRWATNVVVNLGESEFFMLFQRFNDRSPDLLVFLLANTDAGFPLWVQGHDSLVDLCSS